MDDVYRAVVALRYPDSEGGVKMAREAKTQEDFEAISWAESKAGERVPDYIIKASPWLIEKGKVEKGAAPAKAKAKSTEEVDGG